MTAKKLSPEQYLFVIDTDSYAGNFERELCAYITGQIGDCGVGKEFAEKAKKEIPETVAHLEKIIAQVCEDDNNCYRPVNIYRSPKNSKYNSVAIYFNELPDKNLIDIMKERAISMSEHDKFNIEGFRLIEKYVEHKERKI